MIYFDIKDKGWNYLIVLNDNSIIVYIMILWYILMFKDEIIYLLVYDCIVWYIMMFWYNWIFWFKLEFIYM